MGARRMSASKKKKRRAHKEKRLIQEKVARGEEAKDAKGGSLRSASSR